MLATPVETVPRATTGDSDIQRILALATEHEVVELVVGLPLGLSGHRTPSTHDAEEFAVKIADSLQAAGGLVHVRLVDERLSTVSAQHQLRGAGKKSKHSRNIIDQAAAVVILQHALDVERARSAAPGTVVEPTRASADPRAASSSTVDDIDGDESSDHDATTSNRE